MRCGRSFAACAAGLVALTGCHAPAPGQCPGDPIGTLHLQGQLVDEPGRCAFSIDRSGDPVTVQTALDFTATLASAADGTAWLCPYKAEATALQGSRTGDHFLVSSLPPAATAQAPPCACTVVVTEEVEGDLQLGPDGNTFVGELRNALSVGDGVDPNTCEPANPPTSATAASSCGVSATPCLIRWTLTTVQ